MGAADLGSVVRISRILSAGGGSDTQEIARFRLWRRRRRRRRTKKKKKKKKKKGHKPFTWNCQR
jgi:hypothetical protein